MLSASISHVSRRFGARFALDDVTLHAQTREIVGIVGPNGAGKTTLLRVSAGLLSPSAGEVSVHGALTVRYFGGEHTLPPDVRADAWSRLWSITNNQHRRLGVLSRGTRQRIGLESVLHEPTPSLVLLDEPWEGLDPDAGRWLSRRLGELRDGGSTVVVSSHRIHDLATVCDRCEFLVGGRLADGPVMCSAETSHEERVSQLLRAFDDAQRSPWMH